MRAHETAKEFLRHRWALRRNQPFTPIQEFERMERVTFSAHFNESLPDGCRLQAHDVGSAAGGRLSPPAATNQE
jgi:hypothetical protein